VFCANSIVFCGIRWSSVVFCGKKTHRFVMALLSCDRQIRRNGRQSYLKVWILVLIMSKHHNFT